MMPGTLLGRGSNGRRPSGMLYARDSAQNSWYNQPLDITEIERFARRIGLRVNDRGSIYAIDIGGHERRGRHPEAPGEWAAAHRPSECVSVTCWCERAIVSVPLAEVRAGLTHHCIRRDCVPPNRAVK